ncbi:hypothetical protein AMATHDRAFT_7556, partial [Amanita thiersii Skay4041]
DEDPRGSSHDSSNESSSDQFLSSNETDQEIPDPQPLPGAFNKEPEEPLPGPSQPRQSLRNRKPVIPKDSVYGSQTATQILKGPKRTWAKSGRPSVARLIKPWKPKKTIKQLINESGGDLL